MISFADLTKQVHLINDLILSDMVCDNSDSEDAGSFIKHLLATKYWFVRVSWTMKKHYLLALLQDIRSAWTLSLLLKAMWNCRPKDAVLSFSEKNLWSSYDQVPMDNNRTAQPSSTLAQVMKSDRIWFLSLDPISYSAEVSVKLLRHGDYNVFLLQECGNNSSVEPQALVLSELLTVSGGPVMWEVLRHARMLYERYRDKMLRNLHECIVVDDTAAAEKMQPQPSTEKGKKDAKTSMKTSISDVGNQAPPGNAQKELDANLAAWNATIKSMKDSLKLEEVEMTFTNGTKQKIWKVNRPKPEVIETVDFLQLLPSAIGKRILSFLPRMQLGDYARVNKYWAYLVDDYRAELAARQKIDADFMKLNDMLLRYDTSLELVERMELGVAPLSSQGLMSTATSTRMRQPPQASIKASEKSVGAYSLRNFLKDRMNKPSVAQKPIRNLAELTERLERRGAADENLWNWCESTIKNVSRVKKVVKGDEEGVLQLGNVHFPCPMMKLTLQVPLKPPLYKDPSMIASVLPRKNISDATLLHFPRDQGTKRYSLWTRDVSSLYPVFKIPSHQCPI